MVLQAPSQLGQTPAALGELTADTQRMASVISSGPNVLMTHSSPSTGGVLQVHHRSSTWRYCRGYCKLHHLLTHDREADGVRLFRCVPIQLQFQKSVLKSSSTAQSHQVSWPDSQRSGKMHEKQFHSKKNTCFSAPSSVLFTWICQSTRLLPQTNVRSLLWLSRPLWNWRSIGLLYDCWSLTFWAPFLCRRNRQVSKLILLSCSSSNCRPFQLMRNSASNKSITKNETV